MRAVVQQSGYGVIMKKALELIRGLHSDEDGASLVEYTMLLAIIVLAVIGTLGSVGRWVNNTWSGFFTALNAAPTP
jgi:pilus assembly protein Flp/PilA